MLDIANSDAFTEASLGGALAKIPYKPSRLGPGGLNLFDERPMDKIAMGIERVDGKLVMIADTPRGAPGDITSDNKRGLYFFGARHLKRSAKIFADEVQGVRVFGSEDQMQTIEMKRNEKLALLQAMHEVTWEYHRVGALLGKVLDADGTTVLLDAITAFGVSQTTKDFNLTTSTLDVRLVAESVADVIDGVLGAASYDRIHAFCGANFYDALVTHTYVRTALQYSDARRLLDDQRGQFTIGPVTFERAKRWSVKNPAGTMVNFIDPDKGYAFPVGVTMQNGQNIYLGRFAPQPFLSTVNRLNPPLVVKAVEDPGEQFIDLIGISCPLFLNAMPESLVILTKS